MVVGIGCDLLKLSSIVNDSLSSDNPFVKKVYTPEEQKQAATRDNPKLYLRMRFCGKEAVCKTLRLNGDDIRLNEIEILNDENGAPYVNLYGALRAYAKKKGIFKIKISLSYDGEYAMAYAVALKERNQSC